MGKSARLKKQNHPTSRAVPAGLLPARPSLEVRARHIKLATSLVDLGVEFRPWQDEDTRAIVQLVRSHILGSEQSKLEDGSGVIVARDINQKVIGCAVLGLGVDDNSVLLMKLTSIVVVPEWRGKGLGTVMLGVIPQIVPDRPGTDLSKSPLIVYGSCSIEGQLFYQRAGFNVQEPGLPLQLPFGNGATMHNTNTEYPCWFWKVI